VLKKLTATGILAAAATGVMLFGGSANADLLSAGQSAVPAVDPCYVSVPTLYRPAWCSGYAPAPVYPPTTYDPPATYNPPGVYYPGYGWNRWHHPYHWHH